jgi:hypothetical protein
MRLQIVTKDGVDKIYQITPRIEVAFEREWKGGFHKIFRTEEKTEHVYWLSWKCIHSNGDTTKSFDDFLDSIESVDILGDDPNG